jgi:hypothetical protein
MEYIACHATCPPSKNLLFAASAFAPHQAQQLNKQNKQLENTPCHPYN